MTGRPEGQLGAGADRSGANVDLKARRRLLRGGVGIAPVLMSVASGPVIAGQAFTASARASAPLSGAVRGQYTCTGRSPVSWCTKSSGNYVNWPSTCVPGTTTYHGSGNCQVAGSQCNPKTHTKIMNSYCGMNGEASDTTSLNKLAAHCAASLLNVEKGYIDARVLDKAKIQAIWNACAVNGGTGTWAPVAGVTWTVTDVCNWMATTWA